MDCKELCSCPARVERLNRGPRGWANYFCLGPVSKAYSTIDSYTYTRLRRWHCSKHKIRSGGYTRFPAEYFQEELGLIRLWKTTQRLPWAKA
jgi:RNA-directed DNA polymerase